MENSKNTESFLKITYSSKELTLQLEVGELTPFLKDNRFSQETYNKFLENTIDILKEKEVKSMETKYTNL